MAIKYYKNGEWKIFPGTLGAPGKGAYEIAVENGYSGTREEFEEQVKSIVNFSDELQENSEAIQELQKQIDNLKNNGVDLSDYYTKSVSDSKYQPKGNYLTSVPSEYITETELNAKNYATKSDLEDLDIDLSDYYNKGEIDKKLDEISSGDIDLSEYATTAALTAGLNRKQDTLVSGTSIKTINGIDLLGSGNVVIEGGSGDVQVIPGPGYQYIFLLTEDPNVNSEMNPALQDAVQDDSYVPSGWFTSPQEVSEVWEYQWVSTRRKIDGVWEKFTEPVIYNNYVNDGITPDVSFTSFIFCRTNDNFTASDILPTGGTYKLPKPSNPGTIGGKPVVWSDTVPVGTAKIWMSSYTFKNTENYEGEGELVVPTWSTPRQMSDTANFQVEFSKKVTPIAPESLQSYYNADSINYEENWRKNNTDWVDDGTDAIWMATSTMSNGVWSDWQVVKIKGEDGADGTRIKILGTLKSTDDLPDKNTYNGEVGAGYLINGEYWVWDGDSWENAGPLQGPAGEPGATPFLHIKYATLLYDKDDTSQFASDGTWLGWTQAEDEIPGETPGDYIGLYVEYATVDNPDDIPDDKLNPGLYTWSKWNGEDGWFYEYIYTTTKTYSAPKIPTATSNSSGKTSQDDEFVPDGWYDDPVDVSETNPYCWQCYRRKVAGVWSDFKGSATKEGYAALWSNWGEKGDEGEDGAGIEYIYAHSQVDTNVFANSGLSAPDKSWGYDQPKDPWTDNPQGVSKSYPIEWVSMRAKAQGSSSWKNIEWSTPTVWSRFSSDGKDGPGLEYVFLLSASETLSDGINQIVNLDANQDPDYTPSYNYGGKTYTWVDNNSEVTETLPYLWSSIRRKKDGVWQKFETPVLWNRFVKDGISPSAFFKAFAFIRQNTTPQRPEGGSYSSPKPTTEGWSDGIPDGNAILWASTRVFTSDGVGQDNVWSDPKQMTDSANFQVEFSSETTYTEPTSLQDYYEDYPTNYEEKWREYNPTWTDSADSTTIWMATATLKNGVWSDWSVAKIKGEDGQDGTSIKVKGSYESLEDFYADWRTEEGEWIEPADASDCYVVVRNLYVWDGDNWKDVGPFKGDKGDNAFLHIKYANPYSTGTEFKATIGGVELSLELTSSNGEVPGKYIGTFADEISDDPILGEDRFSKYKWSAWQGEDGFLYEYIYKRTETESAPELPKSEQEDDHLPEGWTDSQVGVNITYRYEWVAHRKKVNGVWSDYIGSKDESGGQSIYASLCAVYSVGKTGDSGTSPYHIELSNEYDQVYVDENWNTKEETTITSDITVFHGDSVLSTLNWFGKAEIEDEKDITASIEGSKLKVNIPQGKHIENKYVNITLTITIDGKELTKLFKLVRINSNRDGDLYVYPSYIKKDKNGVKSPETITCNIIERVVGTSSEINKHTTVPKGFELHITVDGNESIYQAQTNIAQIQTKDVNESIIYDLYQIVNDDQISVDSVLVEIVSDGQTGENGTSVKIVGSYDSITDFEDVFKDDNGKWIAPTNESDAYIVAGRLYVWNDEAWVDVGQINGKDGQSMYIHVKYSEYPDGTNFNDVPNKYIGIKVNNNSTPPASAADYEWTKFVGDDGWGYEYQYLPSATELSSDELDKLQKPSENPGIWSDDYPGVSEALPYVYITYSKTTDPTVWSIPSLFAHYGKGEVGPTGRMLYPAGVWKADTTYTLSDNTAPYVWYGETYWYLVTDSSKGNTPAAAEGDWKAMEKYSAIYSDIGVFSQALVGQAVFYGDFMFSQCGIDKLGNETEAYNLFKSDTSDPYDSDNDFRPNLCFNLRTGQAWLSAGKVMFDTDGSGHLADNQIKWYNNGTLFLPSMATISAAYDEEGLNINVQQVYSTSGKQMEELSVFGTRNAPVSEGAIITRETNTGLSHRISYKTMGNNPYTSLTLKKKEDTVQTINVPFGQLSLASEISDKGNNTIGDPYLSGMTASYGDGGGVLDSFDGIGKYRYCGLPTGSISLLNTGTSEVTLRIYGTNVILSQDTVTLKAGDGTLIGGGASITFEVIDLSSASIHVRRDASLT